MKAGLPATPDLPPPPPEEYPRTFGNYLLMAPLARGGMGEVFLAKHGTVAGLEKHCVVKTLRPHLTDDREYTTRFIDEARIVVQLNHRNICHVFDVGAVGERYYLAMEYIAGRDLRTVTFNVGEQGGVLNPGLTLHCVCEVLEALDYAHRHSDAATGRPLLLVHRDVSPQNVMVSWEGEVKLIDFGLAASSLKMEQTSPNVVMGKLAYMAPEQVRGERVDGRADQFAVGVMLYEVLIGERFYEGRSPYEIWGIAAQGGYRPRGWEVLDVDMRAMLDSALAATANGRYATCNEFREALQAYRYARGLHGDGPMLRALMQKVFQAEIDESRKTMAILSQARPRQPVAGVVTFSAEPTMSIARAPSLPNARSPEPPAVREPTEPTQQMLKQLSAQRRRTPMVAVAAAVAVVGVLVGALVARQLGLSNGAQPTDAGTVVVSPDSIAMPPPDPPPFAPLDPMPGVVDAGQASQPTQVDAGRLEPKPNGKKHSAKKGSSKKAPDPVVDVAPVLKAESAAAPSRGYADLDWPQRVDELNQRCPTLGCSAPVALHRNDYGRFEEAELRQWKADLRACWDACKLPD